LRFQPRLGAACVAADSPASGGIRGFPRRPARNGTPAKGQWGGVNGSSPTDLDGAEKTAIRKSEIITAGPIPPCRHASFRRRQGRWGWVDGGQVEMPAAKKLSLQVLYPPPRRGTGLRPKDDGGGVNGDVHHGGRNVGTSQCRRQPEKYRCRTFTPAPPRRYASFHRGKDDGDALFLPMTLSDVALQPLRNIHPRLLTGWGPDNGRRKECTTASSGTIGIQSNNSTRAVRPARGLP
jgi:hypothetical protein